MEYSSARAYQIKYVVFACLLLLLKWKGVVLANKTTVDNDSKDLVVSFSSSAPQIKYDVFLSFRGDDTREGFLSHLNKNLHQKQIFTFVDDKLPVGCEISKALLEAIERSLISLVIFSQNYASSSWCLLELVKIVECREKDGQIVLPVFYKVDPSHVRHQKGAYENAFAEHEKNYSLKVQTWRSALKETANLAGFHSSNFRNEAELAEEIVKWVQKRLKHVDKVNSKGLVGIAKPISHVESLLRLDSEDVRIIGIWGMGGVGKTTIAEEVYYRLHADYEGYCFLANVREELGRQGIISLKIKLFSTLLGEQDLKIETPNVLPPYVEKRLRRMKVLIVLDDINYSEQLEILVGTHDRFKNGSRIIITTRDKQVLAKGVHGIYEVEALDFDESLRLFNLNAFEHNHIDIEYYELSKTMVKYAEGIPLVLKVWGHLLRGKKIEIWESQSKRLKKVPNKKVHDFIKISIDDDLHHDEKKIFLDIACFFDGLNMNVDKIKLLSKDHDYSVAAGLERLQDKALITISEENIVSMHDIIQETAWEMVRQESIEDPGNRSRLLDTDDIYQVLKNNKGSEAIRSIVLNSSMIKELQLSPQVFAKMSKLQFLDLYCDWPYKVLYLPHGLDSLPNELRYLRWACYPLESLPSMFSAENLVELNLPYSRVKKLWHQVQDLENLNTLVLHSSTSLVELPDFSKATNLKVIDLRFCVELTSVHPSVLSINKLEKLDLGGCISLTSLGSNIHLSSLRYLSLYGTGIKQLPSSIALQSKLEKLNLARTYIGNLPASIKHLTKLRHLAIHHCRELQTIPELPPSLEMLDASGCISLETVLFPSTASEQLNENKKRVAFWNCLKLDEHSLRAIELNAQVNMMKFAFQHLSIFGRSYDAQITYVDQESIIQEWLFYRKTTSDFLPVNGKTTRDFLPVNGKTTRDILPVNFLLPPHSLLLGSILRRST
ncbi:putative disease resistance protein At4g11170 [Gastrolobium bilobum]|uniref:putative disease resistance protein At4g11170 n=1 Tax=Gastrolobium bilobum TaxID=150636 RepID=UPI002AB0EC5D|nr:putative disease resistance protein At4g11170 [Gastrolobium bilobum]